MTTERNEYGGASAAAIRHHYDVGNDFYELWLDPTLSYSCALWDGPAESLQTAQERKLDYHARAARADEARRVLDVGCGWGGMMRRLVEQHGVEEVVGLTLSDAQAEHVRGFADERYDVRVENWVDHEPDGPYDAIVSIGAFEHFADYGMTRVERTGAYRQFFERCREWLPERGRLSLQTMTKGNNVRLDRRTTRELLFVVDRIFPESEIPWPSEVLESSERLFDVVSARNDPDHYARTFEEWLAGLQAVRERAEELAGAEIVDDWVRFLRTTIGHFRNRHLGLLRVAFERA